MRSYPLPFVPGADNLHWNVVIPKSDTLRRPFIQRLVISIDFNPIVKSILIDGREQLVSEVPARVLMDAQIFEPHWDHVVPGSKIEVEVDSPIPGMSLVLGGT